MQSLAGRLFPRSTTGRDYILAASSNRAAAAGLGAGILTGATAALALELLFIAVGLLATISTIERFGAAQFASGGVRPSLGAGVAKGAAAGASLMANVWPGLSVLVVLGIVAAFAYQMVGRGKPSWSLTGAFIAIFAVCATSLSIWAFWARLTVGEELVNRDFWSSPGRLYTATNTDGKLLALTAGLSFAGAAAIFTVWRSWFERIAAILAGPPPAAAELAQSDPNEPAAFRQYQERMRRLKLDSAVLRQADTRWRRPDPILESTQVVEREVGRSVPPWMEPVAGLNAVLGRPLMVVFAAAFALWFGANVVRDRQQWEPQRGSLTLAPDSPTLAVVFRVEGHSTVLRLFGTAGQGTVKAVLERPEGAEPVTVAEALRVAIEGGAGSLAGSPAGSPAAMTVSHDLSGSAPGTYRLLLSLEAGDAVGLGYALGHTTPGQWRTVALLLGVASAGLVFSGAGLVAVGVANLAAYFWR